VFLEVLDGCVRGDLDYLESQFPVEVLALGVALDVVEVGLLGALGSEELGEASDHSGSGSLSPVAFFDVDEVDEADGGGGVVGSAGHAAVGESDWPVVFLCYQDEAVLVVEHLVYLVWYFLFSLVCDVPDVGVGCLVVVLEGVSHLGEVVPVLGCGLSYG